MSRGPSWLVLKWTDFPERIEPAMPFRCACGFEGPVPSAALPNAKFVRHTEEGFLHFDPPSFMPGQNWLPDQIACPKCGFAFVSFVGAEEVNA